MYNNVSIMQFGVFDQVRINNKTIAAYNDDVRAYTKIS